VIEDNFGITCNFTDKLGRPDMVAVIFVIPTDMPFAKPVEEMVAAAELELVHVIWELMSFVDPSE
jgi:hypothetical protein